MHDYFSSGVLGVCPPVDLIFLGFYWGRERTIYIDVSQITESVIDQLEALGFIHKIINEDGEEELVPHPEAIKTDD